MRYHVLAATLLIFSISTHASASIVKIDVSGGATPYLGDESMTNITNDLVKLQANTGGLNSVALGHNDIRIDLSYRNMYSIDPTTGLLGFGDSTYVDMKYSFSVDYNNSTQEQTWTDMANDGFRTNTPSYVSGATKAVMTPGVPDGFTDAVFGINNHSVSVSSLSGTTLDALSSPTDDPGHFLSLSLQGIVGGGSQNWDTYGLIASLNNLKLEEIFYDPFPSGYDTGLAGADQATIDQYLNDNLPTGFDLTIMLGAATAAELGTDGDSYYFSTEMHIRSTESAASKIYDENYDSLDRLGTTLQAGISDFGALKNVTYSVQSESIGDPTPTPEPATMMLFGTGIAGLLTTRLRRKKNA